MGDTAEFDSHVGRLDGSLALAERDLANGLQDAPWPPHHPKRISQSWGRTDSRAAQSQAIAQLIGEIRSRR
jgi:hypothetical protein